MLDPRNQLAAVLPEAAARAKGVAWLGDPSGWNNRVVRFEADGERRVLKVYRSSAWRRLRAGWSLHAGRFTRAYTIHGSDVARADAEVDRTAAFARAGFAVFPVLARPTPVTTVTSYVEGRNLRNLLRARAGAERTRTYVLRLADEHARRLRLVLDQRDRALLHPAPKLQHVLITAGGGMVHHDFEVLVNPHLTLEESVDGDVLEFLRSVIRATGDGLLGDVLHVLRQQIPAAAARAEREASALVESVARGVRTRAKARGRATSVLRAASPALSRGCPSPGSMRQES